MATEGKLPLGTRIQLPGHFDGPVVLEDARPLHNGYECRVRLADGTLEEAVISQEEAARLCPDGETTAGKQPLADPEKLRLLIESARIRLAYAHDRQLAVSLSGIRTLPHQIEAVYQKMLPQPRLRFLLADDPGAGKTIMAGLLIKELKLREAVERILILCPAPLTIQWQDELQRWFGETFDVIFAAVDQQQLTNPWQRSSQVIASLDYAKQESVRERVWQEKWHLVIIDEAHKCSARTKPGSAGREPSVDAKPDVVAILGKTALEALELISPHGIELQSGVALMVPWWDRKLFPLYHPGPRALIHRSMAKQRADFMLLAKQVDPVKGLIERKRPEARPARLAVEQPTPLQQAVRAILEMQGKLTFFKLTKLLYLADLQALRALGHTFAGNVHLRQVDGPWLPHLDKELKPMEGFEVRRFFAHKLPMVARGPSPRFGPELDDAVLEILTEVVAKYGGLSNAAIKTAVYQTQPMRHILREERSGKDMRNKAVLYRDRAAGGPETTAGGIP